MTRPIVVTERRPSKPPDPSWAVPRAPSTPELPKLTGERKGKLPAGWPPGSRFRPESLEKMYPTRSSSSISVISIDPRMAGLQSQASSRTLTAAAIAAPAPAPAAAANSAAPAAPAAADAAPAAPFARESTAAEAPLSTDDLAIELRDKLGALDAEPPTSARCRHVMCVG